MLTSSPTLSTVWVLVAMLATAAGLVAYDAAVAAAPVSPQLVELAGKRHHKTSIFNKAFVTSATFTGKLGGQKGADAKCARAAKAVGLSGTFKAWLSTSKRNAKGKLGTARGFVRVDGQPFADQVSDIVAGRIFNPLDIDENGDAHPDNAVWTGTLGDGTVANTPPPPGFTPGDTCSDWTSNFFETKGDTGVSSEGPTFWTDNLGNVGNSCNSAQSLYCFDTSHVTPLTVTKTPGRIAFVSKGTLDNTSGIAGADTLCATEASAASLPGTFQALLSTSTTPAAMRSGFNFLAMSEPYVRPDGIKIADAPTIASGAPLDSGIWQNADGTYVTTFSLPWTGSGTPSSPTTTAQTCDEWSTNSDPASGDIGDSSDSGEFWWITTGALCGNSLPIYCLQE
jgi:hypothetical protein